MYSASVQLSLESEPIATAKKTTATTVVNATAMEKYFISIPITSKIFEISK